MNDRKTEIRELARAALDLALASQWAEAEVAYRELVRRAQAIGHWDLSSFHTQLAGVLAERGSDAEAEIQFQLGVDVARSTADDASPTVVVARYFFGEFLVGHERYGEALAVISKSLDAQSVRLEGILRLLEAETRWMLGDADQARSAAARCIELAASEDQHRRFQDRLSALPGWADAQRTE